MAVGLRLTKVNSTERRARSKARRGDLRPRVRDRSESCVLLSSAQPEALLLLRPIERQGANEPAHGDAGGDIAIGDRSDDARRQERERRQEADVARDLLLAFGDLPERLNALFDQIVDPGAGLGDRRQQSVPISRIETSRCRPMDDALSAPGDRWRPRDADRSYCVGASGDERFWAQLRRCISRLLWGSPQKHRFPFP